MSLPRSEVAHWSSLDSSAHPNLVHMQSTRTPRTDDTLVGTRCRQTSQNNFHEPKTGSLRLFIDKGITMPVDKDRKSSKLRQLYYGPYKILKQLSPISFQIQLPAASRIHDVFHCNLLKPTSDSQALRLVICMTARSYI